MITQSTTTSVYSFRDFCRLLFRHKAKIVSCFLVCLAIAAAVIVFWPRSYGSEAKLFVRVGRETVTLDPTATTGDVMPVSLQRESEINSVLELLRSRTIVEKLVDTMGVDTILDSTADSKSTSWPSLVSQFSWLPQLDPISKREQAVEYVGKCMYFEVEKNSNVISVRCTTVSPKLAQEIVSRFVGIYLAEHARVHRSPRSHAFFVEQTALLRENLSDSLQALRDAKNELGIVSTESQRQILRDETIAVETVFAQKQAALAAARGKVAVLREAVAGLPERITTAEVQGYPNVAADNMRKDLYNLEIREAELASRFADDYPLLMAVRKQIELANQPLDLQEVRRTQQTTAVNPTHQQLQLSLLTEESNVSSLDAEVQALGRALAELQKRARLLNEQEVHIAHLEQEAELSLANYATYSEKLEESRIDAALQDEQITNVSVVQPASLVHRPVSPHKAAVLALGLFSAVVLGLGIAILAEYSDASLKTAAEVEERLSLPVLISIPKMQQRQTVLN